MCKTWTSKSTGRLTSSCIASLRQVRSNSHTWFASGSSSSISPSLASAPRKNTWLYSKNWSEVWACPSQIRRPNFSLACSKSKWPGKSVSTKMTRSSLTDWPLLLRRAASTFSFYVALLAGKPWMSRSSMRLSLLKTSEQNMKSAHSLFEAAH